LSFLASLALLFQSHFLAYPLAGTILIVYIVDFIRAKSRNLKPALIGLALIIFSVLISLSPLLGSLKSHSHVEFSENHESSVCGSLEYDDYSNVTAVDPDVIIGEDHDHDHDHASHLNPFDYFSGINLSVFGFDFWQFQIILIISALFFGLKFRRQFLYFLIPVISQFAVLTYVYASYSQTEKNLLLLWFFLFAMLTIFHEKPAKVAKLIQKPLNHLHNLELSKLLRKLLKTKSLIVVFISIVFAATIPYTFYMCFWDIKNQSSVSSEIAEYINKNLPDDAIIISDQKYPRLFSITPLLKNNKCLYSAFDKKCFDYLVYDSANQTTRQYQIQELLNNELKDKSHIYFLKSGEKPINQDNSDDFHKSWQELAHFQAQNPPDQTINETAARLYLVKE
jgi:hypothetical protein